VLVVAIVSGVAYMALSALWFSVMSVLVKLAGARLPAGELVLARGAVTLVLSVATVARARIPMWGTDRRRLALRGLLGFGGLSCFYVAITRLPLAAATILQNTAPLGTAIGAWLVLGERVGRRGAVALGAGFAGVVVVAGPAGLGALDAFGVGVALFGATCSAAAYVTVRSLAGRGEDPRVIVLYFPLVALPLSVPWAAAVWVTPHGVEWLYLLGLGVATQLGQVCLTEGLRRERAGRATAVSYLQLALAVLWGLAFFGEVPAVTTVLGALIVVGAVITLATDPAGRAARVRPAS
jgi:drug/metabolite transporter (DMT)-like permease